MKKITSIKKKVLVVAIFSLSILSVSAQLRFAFNPTQAKEIADFFKKPSMIEGKCNAEVLGIVTDKTANPAFSWDDINTWTNAAGNVFASGATADYAPTVFGMGFKKEAPYNGGISWISMSTNEADDKWNPAIAGVADLKGSITISNCYATTVHFSGTKGVDTVRIAMKNTKTDTYFQVRRNTNLKQIDISGSNSHIRQFEIYSNALEGTEGFVMNNCGNKENPAQFGDWLTNIEKNKFTFSTMPDKPVFKLGVPNAVYQWGGYQGQHSSGMPVGELNGREYEIEKDADIDLSTEVDVRGGQLTTFTWKDQEGTVVAPTSASGGYFSFNATFIGKTIRCELRNPAYPKLLLNTVWVKVVDKYTSDVTDIDGEDIQIKYIAGENNLWISASEIQNISVYSISGLCVKNINTENHSISLADLNAGIYTVKVATKNGEKVAKIIKN